MMWTVTTSSSSSETPRLPAFPRKKEALPLSTSVISPLSIESELISVMVSGASCVLAMSFLIRSRVSSVAFAADPTTISTFATSLRSVLAVMPSQKMFTPPSTTGMLAVNVVFICHGASPSLGLVGAVCDPEPVLASLSTADTTRSTKTLLDSDLDGASKKSMPRGMLNTANWSGIEAG
eukprot:1789842-Rhodomonas_salina.1